MGLGKYVAYAAVISTAVLAGCPKGETEYPSPSQTPESKYVQPYESNDLEKKVQEKPAKDGEYQNPVKDLKKALKDADDAIAKLADTYKELENIEKEMDKAMRDGK
jgi:uncharacterized phage infection (PIP) family protein YhgE